MTVFGCYENQMGAALLRQSENRLKTISYTFFRVNSMLVVAKIAFGQSDRLALFASLKARVIRGQA